jgi:hypothetical protein
MVFQRTSGTRNLSRLQNRRGFSGSKSRRTKPSEGYLEDEERRHFLEIPWIGYSAAELLKLQNEPYFRLRRAMVRLLTLPSHEEQT